MGVRPRWTSETSGYVLAVAATAAAVLLRFVLSDLLAVQAPFFPFVLAVLLSAWHGGLKPGLLATGLGAALGLYLSTRGPESAGNDPSGILIITFLYLVIGVSASLLCGSLHLARRRTEEKQRQLAQAEEQVRSVVEHVLDGIITIDESGTIRSINRAGEKLFGYAASDVVGRNVKLLMPEPFRSEHDTYLANYYRSGKAKIIGVGREVVGLRKDGSTFPMDLAVSEFQVDSRRYFTGIVRDITGRKQSEEELRRERELLQSIIDRIPVMLTVYEPDARLLRLNPEFERVLGWSAQEAAGVSLMEECYPDPEYREQVRAFMESCRDGWMDIRMRTRDGSYRDTSWANLRLSHRTQVGIGIDITARKDAEATLRQSEERVRLLWEAAESLLHADDPDSMLRRLFSRVGLPLGLDAYFNYLVDEQGEALKLASCAGVPAETARDLARLEFGQAICGTVAMTRQAVVASSVQHSEDPKARLVKELGIRVYACYPLLAGERLLGTLSFAGRTRDSFAPAELDFLQTISHYVTLAYERARLIEQLREADRRKDAFLATLAHELRNPLAPVRHAVQILRATGPVAPELVWVRDVIDRQMHQMSRLIDDLMDVSRITRGKVELRRERVELARVVQSAVEESRPLIEQLGHELTVDLPPGPVYLDADLARLAQVFSNLLNNAAKYTERGGRIHLAARLQGGDVFVAVKDTGIGIPADKLRSVFEMFAQVQGTLERSQGGLGIGLSLVKSLVEMHGGTIVARSDGPGKGSEFVVRLAAGPGQTGPASPANGDGTPPVSQLRILVVDDNRDGADSLGMMLRLLGNETQVAYDGVEAVRAAGSFRPEVVLLDIGLPKMNGYDACRHIRQEPWGRGMVLIAVTGWGQAEDRRRSEQAGFDLHLVKPVNPQELLRVLAGLKTRLGESGSLQRG